MESLLEDSRINSDSINSILDEEEEYPSQPKTKCILFEFSVELFMNNDFLFQMNTSILQLIFQYSNPQPVISR